jgi:hypothetical protein
MTTSGPIPLSQSTTFNALVNRVTSLETEVGNGAFNTITVVGNGLFGGILQAVSPNTGTTGAVRIRANAVSTEGYLQFTDNAVATEYAYLKASSTLLLFHVGSSAAYQFLVGAVAVVTMFNNKLNFALATLPIYADNTAAIAGGLGSGDAYRTSAGLLAVRF